MSIFSVSQLVSFCFNLLSWIAENMSLVFYVFFSPSIFLILLFVFSVLHFQCLEKQKGKATKLTISTKDKYKNMPAVTVRIQFWTQGSVDTERPTYSPMKAVRALIKFIRMAILIGSPELRSTAKSPKF